MIRRPPSSTLDRSSAASDVYKRQHLCVKFATFKIQSYYRKQQMSETAKIILEGKTYEFPIVEGSEGEKAIDISKLRAETGHILSLIHI